MRDWYSIPWIIFRERVCDLSVAACRRLISVIITVVRTAVGTAMPIIMKNQIAERMKLHDPQSSVLLGHLDEEDKITIREDKHIRQISLL